MAAVALGVALRLALEGDLEDPDSLVPVVGPCTVAAWWITAKDSRKVILRDQLHEICGDEAAREIMKLINSSADTITKMRQRSDEHRSPTELPRAA